MGDIESKASRSAKVVKDTIYSAVVAPRSANYTNTHGKGGGGSGSGTGLYGGNGAFDRGGRNEEMEKCFEKAEEKRRAERKKRKDEKDGKRGRDGKGSFKTNGGQAWEIK